MLYTLINEQNYERKRENLWKEFQLEEGGIKIKGYHYSYFLKKDNHSDKDINVQYNVPDTSYTVSINIGKVFALVKAKMSNKDGSTKKWFVEKNSFDYSIYDWGVLLEYLRSEWMEGNRVDVLLTKKEFAMIMPKRKR